MKRIIYTLAIVMACLLMTVGCTEEQVVPSNTETDNAGGQGTGDPLKP